MDRLVDRLTAERTHLMPWPGGATDWPATSGTVPNGALLAASPDRRRQRGENWNQMWSRVGPLFPDRVAVLTARTGRGKSAWALQVAEGVARFEGSPVLYASAEMGADDLVARLLTLRSTGSGIDDRWGVAYSTVLRGGAPIDDVKKAGAQLVEDCPNLYLWTPTGDAREPLTMKRAVNALNDKVKRPIFLVVDYLQRFVPTDDDTRRQAVAALSGLIREQSRPDGEWPGMAVLAVSSTARAYYPLFGKTGDMLQAFHDELLEGTGKETGEIEYDAPLLLTLATDKRDDDKERATLLAVPKNRHGNPGRVWFHFAPACGRFREMNPREAADAEATAPTTEKSNTGPKKSARKVGLTRAARTAEPMDDDDDKPAWNPSGGG